MKLISVYEALTTKEFETINNSEVTSRLKQIEILANKYGEKVYKMVVQDSIKPSVYYYIGYSADYIDDQSELYKELYTEDEDGYTLGDRCMISIEEV